ncbi:hypothetical protein CRM22_010950 [Opisthorchis felineus]|uniref:Agenet-like domain-containing protein n=1 Tax=Opisthorchis felineus TaxID=147828 RepID=A0A4S2KLR2_OPIFE|nr:hypothetical protein CRM22_010950 [Opisthorchis felineus]
MIDIEVRGRLGQYIKAFLRNVVDNDAIVSYPSRDQDERLPLNNVRLPPAPGREVQAGQFAEVLFSIADNQLNGQSGDASECLSASWMVEENKADVRSSLSDQLELAAWWPCRVHKVRDDMAVVKLQVNTPSDASPTDITRCAQLSAVTDIVNRNTLRQPTHDIPCISATSIHRHSIEIPKELSEFAADTSVHTEFLRHAGGPVSLFFDKESSSLVVLSTDESAIRNVALLEETHVKMLRQKWAITRSLRQTMRNMEVTRGHETSHLNMTSSRSSADWDTDPNMFYERFYVPQRLMGLAIGAQGHNIRACREMPDVVNIRLRETNDGRRPVEDHTNENGDAALFIVEARTAEAAKQARSRLEFTELYLGVPRRYVGRLIGRRTNNIVSIIEKSGVVQIHFDDHIKGPSEDETIPNLEGLNLHPSGPTTPVSTSMRRLFLRAGGTQATSQPHAEEEYGGFVLSGTRDAVEKARLLISFQLDYIYDLEKMEAEKIALLRNLSHTSDSGGGYPGRLGAPSGPSRGVGGRGGRRPPRGAPFPSSYPPYAGTDPTDTSSRPSQYTDEGGPLPYSGGRRPPRNARGYNGDQRPRRQTGRGGARRSGPNNNYADWNDPTGNNGDVADRRRGSADSDALSHEVESDERETLGRYGQGSGPECKRPDGGETASSLATDDDNFPGGDGSSAGEGCPYPNEPVRGLGPSRGSYKRVGVSDGSSRAPRNARSQRNRQWAGQNGENGPMSIRTPQMQSSNSSMRHTPSAAARQPAQV